MKKLFNILLFVLFISGTTACHKFLAEQSQDQLTPVTTTEYLQLLYGQAYPGYGNPDAMQKELLYLDDDIQMNNIYKGTTTNSSVYSAGNQSTAAALLPWYSWQPDAYEQIVATGQAGNKDNYNSWARYYALIMGANIALDNADASQGNSADKAYLKGQAYGLRAYYYFMLVNFYGSPYNAVGKDPALSEGVPLLLTAVVENSTLYKKRNTVKEVYSQITADLDSSITYLEKDKRFSAYRMNYIAAHLLASRVYLYMEDWNKVITHSNAVIKAKTGLMNLSSPIAQTANGATNAILGPNNMETLWTFGSLNDYIGIYGNAQVFRLSDSLLRCFASNDLRTKNTFLLNNVNANAYAYTWQTNKQYLNTDATAKSFRVAEAYLNRAEAYLQLAKSGNASMADNGFADLNTLRAARYVSPAVWSASTISSPSAALDSCRMERRRELFLEDQRWFDLRRYGMPAITHVFYRSATDSVKYTLTATDKQYILSIPQEVLDRNYQLTQNERIGTRASTLY